MKACALQVGGGNFFRGVDRWDGLDRATADYVGMLATVSASAWRRVACGLRWAGAPPTM